MNANPKCKKHSAAFKAKVGMEAILGGKTVAQIAREYEPRRAANCSGSTILGLRGSIRG